MGYRLTPSIPRSQSIEQQQPALETGRRQRQIAPWHCWILPPFAQEQGNSPGCTLKLCPASICFREDIFMQMVLFNPSMSVRTIICPD